MSEIRYDWFASGMCQVQLGGWVPYSALAAQAEEHVAAIEAEQGIRTRVVDALRRDLDTVRMNLRQEHDKAIARKNELHISAMDAKDRFYHKKLGALRRELAPRETVLVEYKDRWIIGEPCWIHRDFMPSMHRIAKHAEDCGVKLHVNHSLRKLDQVLQDTVVAEALRSNHHAGSAVDLNVVYDGEWFNSEKLAIAKEDCLVGADPVRRFIKCVSEDPSLRWGGDFATPDPVHVDDNLVGRDPAEWLRRVEEIRGEG